MIVMVIFASSQSRTALAIKSISHPVTFQIDVSRNNGVEIAMRGSENVELRSTAGPQPIPHDDCGRAFGVARMLVGGAVL